MLILKKDDIKKCFTMRDAIEADKEALEIYSEGKAKVPLRTNIDIDEKKWTKSLYASLCWRKPSCCWIKNRFCLS